MEKRVRALARCRVQQKKRGNGGSALFPSRAKTQGSFALACLQKWLMSALARSRQKVCYKFAITWGYLVSSGIAWAT